MEAIRFVNNYEYFLNEIREVVRPELLPIIEELKEIYPHGLISLDTWFQSEGDARGLVWSLFIKKALYNSDLTQF